MHRRGVWIILSMLLLVAGAAAGQMLWRTWSRPPAGYCSVCLRHEHAGSRVVVEATGERPRDTCCMACALSYQRQSGKRVRIVSVTEHGTHEMLDPARAVFVVGSDESPCQHDMMHFDEERNVDEIRWDRCLPSILAFASRDRAAAFQVEHGGTLRTLSELTDSSQGGAAR